MSLAQESQSEQGHLLLACWSEYPAYRSVREDSRDQALDRHFSPHGMAPDSHRHHSDRLGQDFRGGGPRR
jgi:hypothetical protein